MRVLHLPTSVGGNSWGLSRGERCIGIESKVLSVNPNYINYQADERIEIPNIPLLSKPIAFVKRLSCFLKYRKEYDVFHFNGGTTLLDYPMMGMFEWDLPFYSPDARLFVTFNGCDARQKYPTMRRVRISACHNALCYGGICNSGSFDKVRQKRIDKFSRYVGHMFAVNPDLLWFLPRDQSSFLPYTVANWFSGMQVRKPSDKGKLRIVHAPTNRACKGTDIILASLNALKVKYPHDIEIVLVEGKSYEDALLIYRDADLVVDQVLVGWYGGLAVEVMKMGKPVAVYIREEDLCFVPPDMRKDIDEAFIRINQDTIIDVLGEFILNRKALLEKAENAYQYALKWHDPITIAKHVREYYDGKK